MAAEMEIDESLYSRQRYVLGDSAMQRMAKSRVLLCGLGGLGVEIAKNLVLAGIKSLTVQDSKKSTYKDLSSQFFLREADVKSGRNRAEASCKQLAQLNSYVPVDSLATPITSDMDMAFLKQFQCVILTEASLSVQLKINDFCRSQPTPINFITADVYGVFCWTFCDFGAQFEVVDVNGEDPKETFISRISKDTPGEVTTLENKMHGFEDGDVVTFREVKGMTSLNGKSCTIKVISPYAFTICDTSGSDCAAYQHGGIAKQVKVPKTVLFKSLDEELKSPSTQMPDLSRFTAPANIHLGMKALYSFTEKHQRMPNVWCTRDAEEMVTIAKEENKNMTDKVEELDEGLLRQLSYTCQGCFAPLCTALGGIVAQEALKALTGKFTPLQQWLHLDATEVLTGLDASKPQSFEPQQNRYDSLRICLGEETCRQLANLRLFMVGCGAIGCEMLKNYAMLGVGTAPKGQITITDNDLIEKSNLNRQFLFRSHHIRQPKSTVAAKSAKDINPDLSIEAQQHKVCPQTESTVYTDRFFESQDVIVNALDNVEARRYMDRRCVTTQRPLLESGTMGAKGHVQVIVPHLTESYNSQQDPPDEDIPYCTLKSFPAVIDHCIQWARDKFESSFVQKPSLFNKFWTNNPSHEEVVQKLSQSIPLEGAVQVTKLVGSKPHSWLDCVTMARYKFEKYFCHKAKYLLSAFPADQKLSDGSLFWQSPKRPPTPVEFDASNPLHMAFVTSCARLYADICRVPWTEADLQPANMQPIVASIVVPEFISVSKNIVTDETVQKAEDISITGDDLQDSAIRLAKCLDHGDKGHVLRLMSPACFEKDDDSNGHIDFMAAASNLRAAMYCIEAADRLKIKRLTGRIVPAIATTTAAMAGLVTIELVKIVKKTPLEMYKNCFLNLAIPVFVLSQPGQVEKTVMKNGMTYTLWNRWEIHGNKDTTLQGLLQSIKEKFGLDGCMVVHGVKMVYVPIMPPHKKRLPQLMTKLIRPPADKKYVDLVVAYTVPDEDEEEVGPPLRYFFGV